MKYLNDRTCHSGIARLLLSGILFAPPLGAQSIVATEDVAEANRLIDSASRRDLLPCQVSRTQLPPRFPWTSPRPESFPELDFYFRYTVGFSISCHLGEIQLGDQLRAYIRVKPRKGNPVLLAEEFDVPSWPPDKVTRYYSSPLNGIVISMSGAFAVGMGNYSADFVLTDRQGRTVRQHWIIKAGGKKEARKYPLALEPNTVAPLLDNPWDGKLDPHGLSVTILLHAIPFDPKGARIQVWDRDNLLQSLAALLRQLPCRSIHLVLFNLDQQEEVFRADSFDRDGMDSLVKSLEKLEMATISYEALQRTSWQNYLIGLATREVLVHAPPDAIIFFGPRTHLDAEMPKELLLPLLDSHIPFFYFKFFGRIIRPDGVERLTRSLHGTTFEIYNPDDLAQGIRKMLSQMHSVQELGDAPQPH